MRPIERHEFTIAIICALSLEADAVEALFDETYDRLGGIYGKQFRDPNSYVTGRISSHNVVLSYMPGIGRGAAASVASSLRVSYTGVQLALVVGICGGAPYPSENQQIFLGDVIISDSVIQYDFGRQYPRGFQRKTGVKDTLGRPNQEIRSLLESLKARRSRLEFKEKIAQYLQLLQQSESEWQRPCSDDTLFESRFTHKHYYEDSSARCICFHKDRPDEICSAAAETPCGKLGCDQNRIIRCRDTSIPMTNISVHIGTIASADTVMKSGEDRDRLAKLEHVIGFEMEGAGVWDNIPCIVIKGVCDYADSHKSKEWQGYAAASGASATKAFLSMWNPVLKEDSLTTQFKTPKMPWCPSFVGRVAELTEIRRGLLYGMRTLLLQGPPGIGKSSLVVKYVEEFRDDYEAIFWLDASCPLLLASSFSDIKRKIDKADSTNPIETVHSKLLSLKGLQKRYSNRDRSDEVWEACAASKDVQGVQSWLSSKKSWLLIFDNYRSPVNLSVNEGEPMIERFFPWAQQGHLVITTQSPLTIQWSLVRLGKMNLAAEATEILLSQTSRRQDLSLDPCLAELVTQMDGLPLALASAGSYLFHNQISCYEYLELHGRAWLQLQRNTPQLPSYHGNLHSCWINIVDDLVKSPGLCTILQNWTCLDSQNVWFELINGSGPLSSSNERDGMTLFNQTMSLLSDYGLVEISSDPGNEMVGSQGYNLQRSFHAWLGDHFLKLNDSLQNPADLALSNVNKFSENLIKSGEYYEGLLRLLPHANRCFDLVTTGKISLHRSVTTSYTLCNEALSLVGLARTFRFAGYDKSWHRSFFRGRVNLENPGKAHFLKSKALLSQALRKLEQACMIANNEVHAELLGQRTVYRLKLLVLEDLRVVCFHISEYQELRRITLQMVPLSRLINQRWQTLVLVVLLCTDYIQVVLRFCYFMALSLYLCVYLGVLPTDDTTSGFLPPLGITSYMLSYTDLMFGWGDRWTTLPLFFLSMIMLVWYDSNYFADPTFDKTTIFQVFIIPTGFGALPLLTYYVSRCLNLDWF